MYEKVNLQEGYAIEAIALKNLIDLFALDDLVDQAMAISMIKKWVIAHNNTCDLFETAIHK